MYISKFKLHLKEFFQNKSGNFALIASLCFPVLIMAGALAMDTVNAMNMKTRLQNAADHSSLAAIDYLSRNKNATDADVKKYAANFLQGDLVQDLKRHKGMAVTPVISIVHENSHGASLTNVNIELAGSFNTTSAARMFGKDKLNVKTFAQSQVATKTVTKTENHVTQVITGGGHSALSIMLTLDASSSMQWKFKQGGKKCKKGRKHGKCKHHRITRAQALKQVLYEMLGTIEKQDPKNKYVRIGAATYDRKLEQTQGLTWNHNATRNFIRSIIKGHGTNSAKGLKWAVPKLMSQAEERAHKTRNGQKPRKVLVLLTDGENHTSRANRESIRLCNQAKRGGAKVYTVALGSLNGSAYNFLKQCSSGSGYAFSAKRTDELSNAFNNIVGKTEIKNVVTTVSKTTSTTSDPILTK